MRELVLIPPAHFALLAQPTVRKRGGISREEAIAGRLRNDDVYADAAGSGAFGGPTGKLVVVPEDVRRDVRAVVAILRSAVGNRALAGPTTSTCPTGTARPFTSASIRCRPGWWRRVVLWANEIALATDAFSPGARRSERTLKTFGPRAAVGLDEVHGQVDHDGLGGAGAVLEGKLDRAGLSDADAPRPDPARHADLVAAFEAEHAQRAPIPALDQPAQGVPDEAEALGGRAARPAGADLDQQLRMVLPDVVQVVGHRPPDVGLGVVPEQLEQLQHRAGVALERAQPRRPRKPRPGAFGHEAPHVHVGIARPVAQAGEGPLRVALQEGADGELGA